VLHHEYLPATAAAQQELVLLHGWGCNREVWRPLLARLRPWANITLLDLPGCAPSPRADTMPDLSEVLAQVLQCCPPRAVFVGWSLGGQLAVELAVMAPERVTAVVTICSNPRFVAARNTPREDMPSRERPGRDRPGQDWPGMDPETFAQFRARVAADPIAALQRFDSLMVGGSTQPRLLLRQMRELRQLRDLRELPEPCELDESRELREQHGGAGSRRSAGISGGEREPIPPTYFGSLAGLDWLAALDQRELLGAVTQPRLHVFAQQDGLVPCNVSQLVGAHSAPQSTAKVKVIPRCSHLAPLDAPLELAQQIHGFLADAGLLGAAPPAVPELEKSEVAASFSRAASHYDSVARLQREVGERLLTYLDTLPAAPTRVLDLGCGTGFFRAGLKARYPDMQYVGLDLAEGMVNHARRCSGGANAATLVAGDLPLAGSDDATWLVADAEALPLASESVDLVFSSLALQWCSRLEHVFAELARVLRPGARCVFTSLGPQTLCELRTAWAAVDTYQHVNTFVPIASLTAAAERIPELNLTLESRAYQMKYARVRDLLDELKMLGAHNMNRRRPAGLTSRRALQTMLVAYETQRQDGVLPATYDVIFGILDKGAEKA
jgi:malonyl-CoA O-methyltransferase